MKKSFEPTEKLNIDWNFLSKYLPNYDHRDDVLHSDRLTCYLTEKQEMEKEECKRILEEYSSRKNIAKASEVLDMDLMIEAVNYYVENFHKRKQYFLFGSRVTKTYFDSEFQEVLNLINKDADYSTFIHTEGETTLTQLLGSADGWGGYAEICEAEYNQIKENEKTWEKIKSMNL